MKGINMMMVYMCSFVQFTAIPNDYFGNRLRATELVLRLQLNLTYSFNKTQWPIDPIYNGFPTLVNAAYKRHANQMCKH